MQIQPTNNLSNIQQTRMGDSQVQASQNSSLQAPVDQVEFSNEAQMMMSGVDGGFRADLVADLRSQISSGRYETPERIEMAVERMLDQFA